MTIQCGLCGQSFINNLSGLLTNHLGEQHRMSMQQYLVMTEHNGTAPKCQCGYCNEPTSYKRGVFLKHAKGHNKIEWRIKMHTQLYGEPKCKECDSPCGYKRGAPNSFCSFVCSGKQHGFSKPSTQTKIAEIVRTKYGVGNVAKVPEIRQKISDNHHHSTEPVTEATKAKHSVNMKKRWADEITKTQLSARIKQAVNLPAERKRRSVFQTEKMNDPEYVAKLFGTCWGKFSKLHQRLRQELGLDLLGFESEQIVGKRLVDELHTNKRIAIEINGDYIHANPKKYKAEDLICIPGTCYTAQEKWDKDADKIKYLQDKGYQVYVVWESDDMSVWKQTINNLFNSLG